MDAMVRASEPTTPAATSPRGPAAPDPDPVTSQPGHPSGDPTPPPAAPPGRGASRDHSTAGAPLDASVRSGASLQCMQAASSHDSSLLAFLARFIDSDSRLDELRALLQGLRLLHADAVGAEEFGQALRDLGFYLSDAEADAVLRCAGTYWVVAVDFACLAPCCSCHAARLCQSLFLLALCRRLLCEDNIAWHDC